MRTEQMRYQDPDCDRVGTDAEIALRNLPFDGARVLELGCGSGALALELLDAAAISHYIGAEVDARQHEKNLELERDPRLEFRLGPAEHIAEPDASCDLVLMMRSLHHVPQESMAQALSEAARVLHPGGQAWIAEPVYDGQLNALLSLFHDEREVRAEAFAAVRGSIEQEQLELVTQHFYLVERHFADFEDFDRRILKATHTEHQLSATLLTEVRETFKAQMGPDGAHFRSPVRVEQLRRPRALGLEL